MGLLGWLWRAGPSGFGSSSTAEQVTQGIDASQLTAIVTGATNGIGKETARVLALRGAKVIIPSRTLDSGLKVKQSLLEQNPSAELHVMEMDLSSLDSVDSFARSFNSSHKHLNILINNAGIMACPFQLSRDGIELQFATNHLALMKSLAALAKPILKSIPEYITAITCEADDTASSISFTVPCWSPSLTGLQVGSAARQS
ncbi:short-chain dehydrogenase [Musa troglodytarum]|uniref:Short-chain dehydrogenase n=1 Tax=Musa troglodytarum TaxID=320322 RepID=A0A9E7F5L1_9LILI|nr:short-chain dehydrogenase [Musa troglodytarum]